MNTPLVKFPLFLSASKGFLLSLQCGIVGLPNVGKSTLFNALTLSKATSENYPFCTIEPNSAIAEIYDETLTELVRHTPGSPRVVPASILITDIAGLVKGASQGEGLGNQFLGQIRQVDALIHMVRCFDNPEVIHVHHECNPRADIEVVNYEFMLADLSTVEKSITKTTKRLKQNLPETKLHLDILTRLADHLSQSRSALTFTTEHPELTASLIKELHLLSAKKQLYVCNMAENPSQQDHSYVEEVTSYARTHGGEVLCLSAQLEAEVSQIEDPTERREFLEELGMKHSGLERLSQAAYALLDVFHYFTAGPEEVRAWTIPCGTSARAAAGVIHTDFARGFICAEVYQVTDLVQYQTKAALKAAGLIRTEGQDYQVQVGDVLEFRFNIS